MTGVLLVTGATTFAAPPPHKPASVTQPVAKAAQLPVATEKIAEAPPPAQADPVAAALAASARDAATPPATGTAGTAGTSDAGLSSSAPNATGSNGGSVAPAPTISAMPKAIPPMTWLLDPAGTLTLSDVLLPSHQNSFIPYDPLMLPRKAGTAWFRLDPVAFQKDPHTHVQPPLVLDLNTLVAGQIPGTPQVWLVARGEGGGSLIFPKGDDLFQLPDPLPEQAALYIRTSGLPAPGFAPMLRNAGNLTAVDRDGLQILLTLLGVSLLLCLARGVVERREWRMWAALYIGAVWVQAFWGLPSTPAGVVSLWDMPGLLAPGVALLILPHVGRHLMRTREQSPFIDAQLILL
ncbi:MAG: molecular chaperone Hsp90, partial [Bilophila sp.]